MFDWLDCSIFYLQEFEAHLGAMRPSSAGALCVIEHDVRLL